MPASHAERIDTTTLAQLCQHVGHFIKRRPAMKKIIALVVVLVMCAGVAVAIDKPADKVDFSIENPSRLVFVGVLDDSSPEFERGVDYSAPPDPNCAFPLADHSSGPTKYAMHCFMVTDDTAVLMEVVDPTTISDTTIYIYCSGFDPSLPLEENVFWDDDDGVGLRSAFTVNDNIILTPGLQYWLVVSTYYHTTTLGEYTVQTSDNVVLCSTAAEQTSWGSIKSLFD